MRAGVLVQWLKLPAWEIGDCRFEPRSGIQVSKKISKKKQNVSSLLTCKDSILYESSVTENWQARPQTARVRILCLDDSVISFISPSSLQEVLLAQFSLYVHKGCIKPHLFHGYRVGVNSGKQLELSLMPMEMYANWNWRKELIFLMILCHIEIICILWTL